MHAQIAEDVPVDTVYSIEVNDGGRFELVKDSQNILYTPRKIRDSVLERIRKDEAFWYANYVPRQKRVEVAGSKGSMPFYARQWFRTLLWGVIIVSFIAIVIWFLSESNVSFFRKKSRQVTEEETEGELPEDIFSINFEREINRNIGEKKYPMAVRLMYLHTLRLLSQKDIIQYKEDRTNSDYLMQLFGSDYYKDFFRLTRDFEYTWYGKFEVSDSAFAVIRQHYTTFKNRLQS